jgi:hypothetical protein
MDLQEVGWGMDWIEMAQNTDRWRDLVNAVTNRLGYIKCGEFLDWPRSCLFLKDCAPWSSSSSSSSSCCYLLKNHIKF